MPPRPIVLVLTVLAAATSHLVSAAVPASVPTNSSPALARIVTQVADSTLAHFRPQKLEPDQLALTLVDLRDPAAAAQASYRGEVPIYPASVVKLFYLAATHRWLEDGRIADTPELRRAMHDMIVDSSNDATSYIVDVLTGTTSGPELPDAELKTWFERREAVNRYFAGLGYTGINVNKKPWGDGPYGRETQAAQVFEQKRNALTTAATARLLTEIATGRCISPTRSTEMMKLLSRDPASTSTDPDNQARFLGAGLPPGAKLWSKAGWTSQTRHDAAYIELPDGTRFVLVVFTTGHAADREILPAIARSVVAAMTPAAK